VKHKATIASQVSLASKQELIDRPSLRLIKALHRGEDSYITFHRKTGKEKFKNLFSIRASHLTSHLSSRSQDLYRDAYFSINGYWNSSLQDGKPVLPLIKWFSRKVKHLRYLNAIYVDIDCYNRGISPDSARAYVKELIKTGSLPPPSCAVASGGVWLFWILRSEDEPSKPPRADRNNLAVYMEIENAIGGLLRELGADPQACGAARATRFPGSVNSKNDQTVRVLWPKGKTPKSYTLDELSKFLDLREPSAFSDKDLRHRVRESARWRGLLEPTPPDNNPWTKLNQRRLNQFLALWEIRGGFSEGCRKSAALIYARLLTMSGFSPPEVKTEVEAFGAFCKPPLTPSEVADAVKCGSRMKGIRIYNIRKWLSITWHEHLALKDQFGQSAWDPAPSELRPPSDAQLRREAIRRTILEPAYARTPKPARLRHLYRKAKPSL
jgi:hypothetical protein